MPRLIPSCTASNRVELAHSAGFTFIELMITLAIMGILVTTITPEVKTMFVNREADTLSSQLEVDIQFARNQAFTRTRDITVRAISGDWSIGWEVIDNGKALRKRGSTTSPMTQSGNITSSYTNLVFNTQGRAESSGNFKIQVPYCTGNRRITLKIQSLGQLIIEREKCT